MSNPGTYYMEVFECLGYVNIYAATKSSKIKKKDYDMNYDIPQI